MKGLLKKIGIQVEEVEEDIPKKEYIPEVKSKDKIEQKLPETAQSPRDIMDNIPRGVTGTNIKHENIIANNKNDVINKEGYKKTFFYESEKKMDNNLEINNGKNTTVISADTEIIGSMRTEGNIELNGTLNGDLEAGGYVVIKGNMIGNIAAESANLQSAIMHGDINVSGDIHIIEDASLEGNVSAGTVRLDGKINGNIYAEHEVGITQKSMIIGNIQAERIGIEAGAVIKGKMETIKEETKKEDQNFNTTVIEQPKADVKPEFKPNNIKQELFKESLKVETVKTETVKVDPVRTEDMKEKFVKSEATNDEPKNDFKATLEKRMLEKSQLEKNNESTIKAPIKPNVNASVDQLVNKFTTFKK